MPQLRRPARGRDYRDLVAFERLTGARDALDQVDETLDANWSELGRRYAEAVAAGSAEARRDRQTRADAAWSLTLRSDALARSLAAKDRVRFLSGPNAGRVLAVAGTPTPVGNAGREVALACKEPDA